MPSRNIVKEFVKDNYYHVYSRGVNKQDIFLEEEDYVFFLSLFKRYLSKSPALSSRHGPYPHYGNNISLTCFCLMPNHIHLLIYQHDEKSMPELMRAILTSYSQYFNKKYKRIGPVFQSRYKASMITSDSYLLHITRYIHLNPRLWEEYPFSSIGYYINSKQAEWLKKESIASLFQDDKDYRNFLNDYRDYKDSIEELKWDLASYDID